MRNQLKEGELLVNRVKLLMGYDMSKTLNENTQHIFEQPDSKFMSPEEREILARCSTGKDINPGLKLHPIFYLVCKRHFAR